MEQYKDYKLKSGNILRVIQDDNSKSPDSWDNEDMFLVYNHRQFTVKREGFNPYDIWHHIEATKGNKHENYLYDKYNDYYIFPVDAYIHSGVSLSLAGQTDYPDRRWDVSTTGYVLVKKEMVKSTENLDANKVLDFPNHLETRAREYAEGLIETWNQYLSGDVYGFQVMKQIKTYTITEEDLDNLSSPNDVGSGCDHIYTDEFKEIAFEEIEHEELDSCWGFYGDNPKTNGILDHINDEIIEQ